MPPVSSEKSSTAGIENASGHEQSAGGLSDFFAHNQKHRKATLEDGYQMPTKFNVTTDNTGVYQGPYLQHASAELLNELLKKNQMNNHLYFTETGGFHNHRAHHLLAAYALGATTEELQFAYDTVEGYQRDRLPIDAICVNKMYESQGFKSMLGDDQYYHDYLVFFWQKFERHGWKNVVNEYLFSGSELAEDLFTRLFAGIWHNLILLGYGMEFEQPGMIAEGLAGACVHSNVFGPYLFESEKLAKTSSSPCKSLVELLEQIRNSPNLCDKEHWQGGNSFAYDDNVSSNAPPGMAALAAQWKVDKPEDLEYRTVELINGSAFIAGAAQRPEKVIKIDFIYVHTINASIFFSAFLEQNWISTPVKTRLLEWYTRLNLLFYAASLGPELRTDEVVEYKPLKPESTWESIIQRCLLLDGDGHEAKAIRALAHGERVSQPYEKDDARKYSPELPVKGSMWLQIANMVIDSTETEPDLIKRWLRGAGSDEAWAQFPNRSGRATG